MKPYWFKLTENDTHVLDEPMPIKPKTYKVITLLGGVLIGVIGSYFLIPPKVVDAPVDKISVVDPVQTTTPSIPKPPKIASVPTITNPMLNPSSDDEDDDDESEDEDDD